MLSVGFYMKNSLYNPELYQLHKLFGIIFCFLIIYRLYWRIKYPWKSNALGSKSAQRVKVVHTTLMALMVFMPITGFMISAFIGFGIHLFGVFIVPENVNTLGEIVSFNEIIYDASKELHNLFAYFLVVLIVLHAFAALKRHIIDKDDTLKRMLFTK